MEKIDFKNEPDTTTPLDAENLNKLQDNIEKEIKDKQGVKELLGTTAKPINANDIKAIGVYRISGEHTNFFDDRTAAFILYVTLDGEKLIQSVILEEGLYSRSATCTIASEEISWNFSEWKFRGGRKEVGYTDEELEGTEKILIEDSDFDGENSVELAKVEQDLSSNSEDKVPSVKAVNNAFESGTGYIKYVDGTMICYGEYSFSAQTLSDYYSFCKLTPSINVTFPKQFKETPTITISSKMFQMFSTFVDSVNNSSFKFRGCYPSNYSSLGGVIDYIAIGRWK